MIGSTFPFESCSIDLSTSALDDKYTVVHSMKYPIGTSFSGNLFGWNWGLTVRRVSGPDDKGKFTLEGDYDVSELLKQYLTFSTSLTSATEIMNAVASQIGKTAVVAIDDHSVNSLTRESKLQDVVNDLFNWTAAVPHRYVNVFIRGSLLHVLQRGKEPGVYTPTKWILDGAPTEERVDTLMDTSVSSPQITGDSITVDTGGSTIFKNGSQSFGNASITWANGLVVRAVEDNGDDTTTTTTTTYDSARYELSSTTEISGDNGTITNVRKTYGSYEGLPYLSGMTSETYKGGTLKSKTEVNYYPRGFNMYGMSETNYRVVTVNGVETFKRTAARTSLVEGRPGGPASPYTINREATSTTTTPAVGIERNPRVASHIPVTDTDTLSRYATGLVWLDGKTKYTLNIRCDDEHIIDYTERVALMGYEWYVNDSRPVIAGSGITQQVELVRWA